MSEQENSYPGIGLLIVLAGSTLLWVFIVMSGAALYASCVK